MNRRLLPTAIALVPVSFRISILTASATSTPLLGRAVYKNPLLITGLGISRRLVVSWLGISRRLVISWLGISRRLVISWLDISRRLAINWLGIAVSCMR